jgi:eukaryotic-like serine/threonine-protein kinase
MSPQYRLGQKIDHYRIHSLLSQGIASSVYRAWDRNTGHYVVLKFPKDDVIGGRAIFERFQREVEIGSMLSHPHIVQHLNQAEVRQEKYFVLEYLQGRTLRAVMAEQGSPHAHTGHHYMKSPDECIAILEQVCEALIYAHKHGVIHHDMKPDNIMLLENGEVKVFDFGIAQFEGERHWSLPGFSPLIGTPDYMAPERLLGKRGSVSTDIYAVGVILYELLCGRTPFVEQDGFSFVGEHISHDPPDILRFNPTLSPTLATIVMRAIRRDAEKRYQRLEDMLYDLRHSEDVAPVVYVTSAPKRGGRYRQVLTLALIILLVVLLLFLFGFLAQTFHHAVR